MRAVPEGRTRIKTLFWMVSYPRVQLSLDSLGECQRRTHSDQREKLHGYAQPCHIELATRRGAHSCGAESARDLAVSGPNEGHENEYTDICLCYYQSKEWIAPKKGVTLVMQV